MLITAYILTLIGGAGLGFCEPKAKVFGLIACIGIFLAANYGG